MNARRVYARIGDATFTVDLGSDGRALVTRDEAGSGGSSPSPTFDVTAQYLGHGRIRLATARHRSRAWAVDAGDTRWVFIDGEVIQVQVSDRVASPGRRARSGGPESLGAPMPATVIRILVAPGDSVLKGDTMVLLEAMKMELPLRAPHDAVVRGLRCAEGDLVQPGAPLVDLEES